MITAELIQPVVKAVTDNITAIVPAGLSILALSLGVSAVPKIIKKFFQVTQKGYLLISTLFFDSKKRGEIWLVF